MTKACEIAVRGRLLLLHDVNVGNDTLVVGGGNRRTSYGGPSSTTITSNNDSNNTGGGTSSRFNIEVDEVPAIRTTLQTWKRALNVPLRLDVYYEHYDGDRGADGNGSGEGENNIERPPPQRELLERWCIDYVPSSSSGNNMNSCLQNDKSSSISQLRQVCKRIVVLLRSLHCLTRILPAYRLKSLIMTHIASGAGVGGIIGGMNMGGREGWGSIGYSIYVCDYELEPTLPSPSFTRHCIPNVATPYGTLRLSVMHDASLNPNHMVADLAEKRAEWLQLRVGLTTPTIAQPIPIQGQNTVGSAGPHASADESRGRRKYGSCPPAALMGGPSSLGAMGRSPAVSDFIISDYHSPALKPLTAPSPGSVGSRNNRVDDEKRVMSGLSLAMMGEEENSPGVEHQTVEQNTNHHYYNPSSPDEEDEHVEASILPWGSSPATRAAFHHPPPVYADIQHAQSSEMAENSGTHFFHHHGGYGYGYNGSQMQFNSEPPPPPPIASVGSPGSGADGLSISPSPLMSTPPQAMWGKPRQLSRCGRAPPSAIKEHVGNGGDEASEDDIAPPFTNPTSLQPLPSPLDTRNSVTHSALVVANGNVVPNSLGSSPHLQERVDGRSSEVQQQKRASSSSALLPPMTSLDLLQKSPFSASRITNKSTGNDAKVADRGDGDGLMMPFAPGSYRDEMFTSSIPRMISADAKLRTSSIGGGSSSNPLITSFGGGYSSAGGYYSTGPGASGRASGSHTLQIDAEEMPFAVDDDFPSLSGTTSPFSGKGSRSLWGSTKADLLDGASLGGVAEITSSLAVSSLHHRCANEGRRLKLFESTQTLASIRDSGNAEGDDNGNADDDFATFNDQLSDFRSFGASLMVGSLHDSRSE